MQFMDYKVVIEQPCNNSYKWLLSSNLGLSLSKLLGSFLCSLDLWWLRSYDFVLNFLLAFWQALSKTLTVDELFYLKEQFVLLEPNKNGTISLENIKTVGCFLSALIFITC